MQVHDDKKSIEAWLEAHDWAWPDWKFVRLSVDAIGWIVTFERVAGSPRSEVVSFYFYKRDDERMVREIQFALNGTTGRGRERNGMHPQCRPM